MDLYLESQAEVSAVTGDSTSVYEAISDHYLHGAKDEDTWERSEQYEGLVSVIEATISKLDWHSNGLYGRDKEIQILHDSLDSCIQNDSSRQVVMISGEAGSGKTSLVKTALQMPAARAGGFFLFGKFELTRTPVIIGNNTTITDTTDEQTPTTPTPPDTFHSQQSAGIAEACQDICQTLLEYRFLRETASIGSSKDSDSNSGPSPPTTASSDSGGKEQEDTPINATAPLTEGSTLTNSTSEPENQEDTAAVTAFWNFSFEKLRTRLLEELGTDASLLHPFMPALKLILQIGSLHPTAEAAESEAAEVTSDDYKERRYKLDWAFRGFMRALSSFGPIVLCLDDIQWADETSLDLIQSLVSDVTIPTMMVGGIYRSFTKTEGDEQEHTLTTTIRKLQERIDKLNAETKTTDTGDNTSGSNNRLTEISLTPMEARDIAEMLGDLFTCSYDETEALAECIHRKTLGNSFYIVQFTRELVKSGLLVFDLGTQSWNWNIDTINDRAMATQEAVDFVINNLRRLPPGIRTLLPLLASSGRAFEVGLVELLMLHGFTAKKDEIPTPSRFLKCLEKQGFIYRRRDGTFAFEHDRIQEAAISLIEPAALRQQRWHLGLVLLDTLDEETLEKHLFTVANLFGDTKSIPDVQETRRIRLANVYLKAGQRCSSLASFNQSAAYLARGVKMLPLRHWETHYELSLDLYSTAAEVLFIGGRYREMKICCDAVIEHGGSVVEKRRAYNAILGSMGARWQNKEALELGLELLKQMNIKFAKTARMMHIMGNVIWTRIAMKSSLDKISKLRNLTDPGKLWVFKLLDEMTTSAYQVDQSLLPLLVMRGYQETVAYGLHKYAPVFLSLVGFLFVNLGDYEGGLTYADLANDLLDKINESKAVRARVTLLCHDFIYHHRKCWEWSSQPFLQGYQAGLAAGDTESAGWCAFQYLEIGLFTGTVPLATLNAYFRNYVAIIEETSQHVIAWTTRSLWKIAQSLMGIGADIVVDTSRLEVSAESRKHVQMNEDRFRLLLAFWLADYGELLYAAERSGFDKDLMGKLTPGLGIIPATAMQIALSALVQAQSTRGSESKKFLSIGKKFYAKIQKWKAQGNPNVIHYEALLAAEMAVLSNDGFNARQNFEIALLFCSGRGFVSHEALAHERFAAFLFDRSELDRAKEHAEKAIDRYNGWGATVRVEALEAKYERQFGLQWKKRRDVPVAVSLAS
ncbi:Transcriptional regulator [Seminavis robusta]|uniref:Transcriptional regulator n=1 Tax=Seminavis robusta TaxID=568900 RepID=A0A9N8E7D7_9STRA|nr:Transcriptional regulator [Seminavis robusta]|eukprot:Sro761_g198560.1 Transcriptional regulator (1207) ;mRNA; r:29390-33169